MSDINTIEIMYHDKDMPKLEFIEGKSDWIDLRAAKDYKLYSDSFTLLDLGISVKLPEGYEAHIAPRSSTFKNYGLIQVNSVGVIDESYCGEDDVWKLPVYATRNCDIAKGDRICQFRIIEKMKNIELKEVESLSGTNRGGFGSTGVK